MKTITTFLLALLLTAATIEAAGQEISDKAAETAARLAAAQEMPLISFLENPAPAPAEKTVTDEQFYSPAATFDLIAPVSTSSPIAHA